jgi:carbon storage regulator CsrA
MLVLARRVNETIGIKTTDGFITIRVVEFRGGPKVRLGIAAPDSVVIHRGEVWAEIAAREGLLPPADGGEEAA